MADLFETPAAKGEESADGMQSEDISTDMFAQDFLAQANSDENALQQGDNALQDQQSFTIKYNGEDKTLPLPELLTLAQKGMNYDKVYSKLQNQQDNSNTAENTQQSTADTDDFLQLCEKYPHLEELPPEAAQLVHSGVQPLYAYESYLAGQLKARVSALEQDAKNRTSTPGSATGIGSTAEKDPFTQGFESAGFY